MGYQPSMEDQRELIDSLQDQLSDCAQKIPQNCPEPTLRLSEVQCAIYASEIVEKLTNISKGQTGYENWVKQCTSSITLACQALPEDLDPWLQCLCQWTSYRPPNISTDLGATQEVSSRSKPPKRTIHQPQVPNARPAPSPFGQMIANSPPDFTFGSASKSITMANPFLSKDNKVQLPDASKSILSFTQNTAAIPMGQSPFTFDSAGSTLQASAVNSKGLVPNAEFSNYNHSEEDTTMGDAVAVRSSWVPQATSQIDVEMECDVEPATAAAGNGGPFPLLFGPGKTPGIPGELPRELPQKPVMSNAAEPSSQTFFGSILGEVRSTEPEGQTRASTKPDTRVSRNRAATATANGSKHAPPILGTSRLQELKVETSALLANNAAETRNAFPASQGPNSTVTSEPQAPKTADIPKKNESSVLGGSVRLEPLPGLSQFDFRSPLSNEPVFGTTSEPIAPPSKPVAAIPPPVASSSSASTKSASGGASGSSSASPPESSESSTTSAAMPARKIAPMKKKSTSLSIPKSDKTAITVASETAKGKLSEQNKASDAKDIPGTATTAKTTVKDTGRVEPAVEPPANDAKLDQILTLLQSEQAARAKAETKQQRSNEDMLQRLALIEADLAQQKQVTEAKDKELNDRENAVAKREAELKAKLDQQKQAHEAKEKALRDREAALAERETKCGADVAQQKAQDAKEKALAQREGALRANEKLFHDKIEQFKQRQQEAQKKLDLAAKNLQDMQQQQQQQQKKKKEKKNVVSFPQPNPTTLTKNLTHLTTPLFSIPSLQKGHLHLRPTTQNTPTLALTSQLTLILKIFNSPSSQTHAKNLSSLLTFPTTLPSLPLHPSVKPAATLFSTACLTNFLFKRRRWCDEDLVARHIDMLRTIETIWRCGRDLDKGSEAETREAYMIALAKLRVSVPVGTGEWEVLCRFEEGEGRRFMEEDESDEEEL